MLYPAEGNVYCPTASLIAVVPGNIDTEPSEVLFRAHLIIEAGRNVYAGCEGFETASVTGVIAEVLDLWHSPRDVVDVPVTARR